MRPIDSIRRYRRGQRWLNTSAALARALAALREKWEAETTARNLSLIREQRQGRGEDVTWLQEVIAELERVAGEQ